MENAVLHKCEMAGLVTDLKKCFNFLARLPLGVLFRKLTWLRALNSSVRVVIIQGAVSEAVPSTTGVPEGDPLGIASIAAYGGLWAWQMEEKGATPFAYADNLEYLCAPRHVTAAADANRTFHRVWKQEISYTKSWTWSTCKTGKLAWERYNKMQTEREQLPSKNHGIDLGTVANYTGCRYTGNQEARISEGIRRAYTLSRFPLTNENTSRAIHASILPHAMYGCEGLFPSLKKMAPPRSASHRA